MGQAVSMAVPAGAWTRPVPKAIATSMTNPTLKSGLVREGDPNPPRGSGGKSPRGPLWSDPGEGLEPHLGTGRQPST